MSFIMLYNNNISKDVTRVNNNDGVLCHKNYWNKNYSNNYSMYLVAMNYPLQIQMTEIT